MVDSETHIEEEENFIDAEKRVTRLLDILTNEVSIVNRGANKRRWLVRKGNEDMTGEEVHELSDGTLTTDEPEVTSDEEAIEKEESTKEEVAEDIEKQITIPKPVQEAAIKMLEEAINRLDSIIAAVKGAQETDEKLSTPIPVEIGGPLGKVITVLHGVLTKYPSPAVKSEITEEDVEKALDEIEEITKQITIPSPVKSRCVEVLQQVRNRLASVIASIKGATVTEDKLPKPLPDQIGKEIMSLATMLEGLLQKYPSPKSATKKEDSEPEQTEKADSPSKMLDEVHKILGVILAKINPGQSLDEDSYQQLTKLRASIANTIKATTPKSTEPTEDDQDKVEKERENTEKAGARMSRQRRKKFEEAIKMLITLFKEVMPSTEMGKMPHLITKVDEKDKEISELKEKLEKSDSELVEARKEINDLKSSPVQSNVTEVESIPVQPVVEDVVWPMDLNSE